MLEGQARMKRGRMKRQIAVCNAGHSVVYVEE
jgi:hypothetical protein